MNTLDIISLNIWQILISLANLVILFLIFKRFLFKPVKDIVAKREAEVSSIYDEADKARAGAQELKQSWEERMKTADEEADKIIKVAAEKAENRNEVLLYESREKAESMIRKAKAQIAREQADAQEAMRKEIVNVSSALSEQVLGREINMDDHRDLIDSFIDNLEDM